MPRDQKSRRAKQKKPRSRSTKKPIEYRSAVSLPDGVFCEQCFALLKTPSSYFARLDTATGKITYVPQVETPAVICKPVEGSIVTSGFIFLPQKATDFGDERALLDELQQFIHCYLAVPLFFERLLAAYALFSWLVDRFQATPYIRSLGDWGKGKSRFLQTVSALSYHSVMSGGAISTAAVFRTIELFHGCLVIDEADFRQSETWSEIVKVLNCGYMKGVPILRCETARKTYTPEAFSPFGCKLLATRKPFDDDALESRCFTIKMDGALRDDTPLCLTDAFRQAAVALQNKLLAFRFRHMTTNFDARLREMESDLRERITEARLVQVSAPLLAVVSDETFRTEFTQFLLERDRQIRADRTDRPQAYVVEAISRLLSEKQLPAKPQPIESLHVQALCDALKTVLGEHGDNGSDLTRSTIKMGNYLRKELNLTTGKISSGRYKGNKAVVLSAEQWEHLAVDFGLREASPVSTSPPGSQKPLQINGISQVETLGETPIQTLHHAEPSGDNTET